VVAAVVVGAALLLLVSSRVWLVEIQARPAPLPPVEVKRTGAALVPALPALALVALAGAGGLLATRGLARMVVGALLALAALGEIVALAGHLGQSGWVALGLAGALLVAAGGAVTLWRGGGWPAMGSRYDRAEAGPAPAPDNAEESDAAIWDAMDRGEDPTDRRPDRPPDTTTPG
jgi:hypothetical protein